MAKSTPAPQSALAVREELSAALAVAEGLDPKDNRGKENIRQSDITLPRVAVAQKGSPQLDPDKAKYIEGLNLYELFNTGTKQVYGNGPVEFVIVRFEKRGMQFDSDNNVVDPNISVEFDEAKNEFVDDRLNFHNDAQGKRVKPIGTLFYDYLIVLADTGMPAMLSLKGASISVGKDLNLLTNMRKGPIWGGKYRVTSFKDQKGIFTFGNYKIAPAGKASPELIDVAENVYETLKGRAIHTDREGPDEAAETDAPF